MYIHTYARGKAYGWQGSLLLGCTHACKCWPFKKLQAFSNSDSIPVSAPAHAPASTPAPALCALFTSKFSAQLIDNLRMRMFSRFSLFLSAHTHEHTHTQTHTQVFLPCLFIAYTCTNCAQCAVHSYENIRKKLTNGMQNCFHVHVQVNCSKWLQLCDARRQAGRPGRWQVAGGGWEWHSNKLKKGQRSGKPLQTGRTYTHTAHSHLLYLHAFKPHKLHRMICVHI